MIKVVLSLFLISNLIMSVEATKQLENGIENIEEKILNFYKKNRNPVCNFDIDKNIKKVYLLYNGNIYNGFLNEKKEPYGEWISTNGFSVECYLNDKKFFRIINSKVLEYYDEEGYFFETKEKNSTNVYISFLLDGDNYTREYGIENEKFILLNSDIEVYQKGWTKVEDILGIMTTKNPNFAKIIYQE